MPMLGLGISQYLAPQRHRGTFIHIYIYTYIYICVCTLIIFCWFEWYAPSSAVKYFCLNPPAIRIRFSDIIFPLNHSCCLDPVCLQVDSLLFEYQCYPSLLVNFPTFSRTCLSMWAYRWTNPPCLSLSIFQLQLRFEPQERIYKCLTPFCAHRSSSGCTSAPRYCMIVLIYTCIPV